MNQPVIRPSTIFSSAASGLPSLREIVLERGALGGDLGLGDLVTAEVGRLGERDVHRDVVGQLLGAAVEHDGHRVDAPARLLVQVGVDDLAGLGHEAAHPADRDVLLERGAQPVDLLVQLADGVLALGGDQRGQLVGQGHELVGLGHEVGLAAQLDDRGGVAGARRGHGALGRLAVAALGRAGQALLRRSWAAFSMSPPALLERVLAVEHAGAGHLAQGGDVLGGVVGHAQATSTGSWAAWAPGGAGATALAPSSAGAGGRHLAPVLGDEAALDHGVGDHPAHERARADGVVVARDHVVDDVGVAVGVDDGHHGEPELARPR